MAPKRKTSSNMSVRKVQKKAGTGKQVGRTDVSPDVIKAITEEVTTRVTQSLREEMTTMWRDITKGSSVSDDTLQTNETPTAVHAVSETVEAVVVNHSENISGNPKANGFISTSVPIQSRVSDKLKAKIWSNQVVDFSSLLNHKQNKKSKLSVKIQEDDASGQLIIHQVDKDESSSDSNPSMHDWITAWNRYVTIYCMKFPEQHANLAKHMEAVRDIADARGDWKTYDLEFRNLISQGQVNWGDIHMELYVNARLNTSQLTKAGGTRTNVENIPKGACFPYHSGKQCNAGNACQYQHMCYNCGGQHPFSTCRKPIQKPFRILPKFTDKFTNQGKQNKSNEKGPEGSGAKPVTTNGPNTNKSK